MLVAIVHIGLGIWSYHVNRYRAGGVWYTPVPGMIAVLALGMALTSRTGRARMGWTLLLSACLLHQLLSFSRGYWFGLMAALPLTAVLFVGRGEGAAQRWRASARAGLLALVVGGGLGMEMHVRYPFYGITTHQSFMHEVYLYILVKQGLVGLLAFLYMLFAAARLGIQGAVDMTRDDRVWLLTCAGITVYLTVVDLTSYHMMQVNAPTMAAVIWGIAIARTRRGSFEFRFAPPARRALSATALRGGS